MKSSKSVAVSQGCIAVLHCPPGHRQVTRTTNLFERLFRERASAVNASGTPSGERELSSMYPSLVRAQSLARDQRQRVERRQLERLRDQLANDHRQRNAGRSESSRSFLTFPGKDGTNRENKP
jgi:hypothetical protein